MVGHQNYWVILQFFENSKRNRERDVNTLGGNTLGLLREVCNFILFKIHSFVVQRSLNENIIFVLYCFRKSLQWYQSKPQLIMDSESLFISVCVLRFISYMWYVNCFIYLFGEVENNKNLCRDWYYWYVDCLVPIRFRSAIIDIRRSGILIYVL